jgi:hypothetical protein
MLATSLFLHLSIGSSATWIVSLVNQLNDVGMQLIWQHHDACSTMIKAGFSHGHGFEQHDATIKWCWELGRFMFISVSVVNCCCNINILIFAFSIMFVDNIQQTTYTQYIFIADSVQSSSLNLQQM